MTTWTVPSDWRSPAAAYPLDASACARLVRWRYSRGVYKLHEMREGAQYYQLERPLPVTGLQLKEGRRWKTWMVDDPLHWEGIQHYAGRIRRGRVLVGGLGLGLIVHALRGRDDVAEIVVVEQSADVIELIGPLVPRERLTIVHDDFWRIVAATPRGAFATIFVDLWVGDGPALWPDVNECWDILERVHPYPDTESLWFGFQARVDLIRAARELHARWRGLANGQPRSTGP